MTPIQRLAERIPAKYRGLIYDVVSGAVAVEVALDAVGWGLIPDGPMEKALMVASLLGLRIARAKTTDVVVVRD